MTGHESEFGIMFRPLFPLASGFPSTETGSLNSIVVFSLAPARQTLPYGTRPPQIFRPFTNGRWYLTAISVSATRCFTSAAWLTSGRFKSFCAETLPASPRMARQRANGLSVIVFIVLAFTLLKISMVRYQIIKDLVISMDSAAQVIGKKIRG